MKFGAVPVADAEGAILAHSLKLKVGVLKKGRALSAEDLRTLAAAGIESVTAAVLEPDDVSEDEAAARLAQRLVGAGTEAGRAFTGRCNLFARQSGLLVINKRAIDAVNALHEAITVATLPERAVVSPRQMVATVKIIPFAVPQAPLEEAERLLSGMAPALQVAPFKRFRAGLLQTRLPGTRDAVLDKTVRVTAQRVAAVGGRLMDERRCEHAEAAVRDAASALIDAGAGMVIVVGASAIVDRRDVVPAGIVAAGGEIVHYGMPMDPGNLTLVARLKGVPLLGLPGSARSPQYNGVDEVLRSLAAGRSVDKAMITALGVGGLLKETADRPLPRGAADAAPATARPRVFALVLAAGQSRRMGARNKLLVPLGGGALVRRVVEAARASTCDGVIVVTGHEADKVQRALEGTGAQLVYCADYASGLSASLRRGVGALPGDCDAAVVCLGDMPGVTAAHIDALIRAYDPEDGCAVCVPTHNGKRGNPVLWDRRFFAELAAVLGDVGARHLIGEHADWVCEVAMDDAGVLVDVDTPEALERFDD